MQSWCRTWPLNGSRRIRAKQKLLRKHKGAYRSSWSRIGNQESFTLTILQNLANLVKIFPGIIVRRHHTDRRTNGIARKSSAQSERRAPLQKCCNQVWMKIGGQILWNAIPICETFKISCLMGKLHAKGGSECFLTDQWYRLDQWSPYLCEGHIEITSIWSKNLARYIPRLCIVRGENLERKHWSQTLRNWKRWTHLKSMLKNPIAKELSTRVSGEKFKFPNRRWNSQTIWKRSGSENIHLDTGQNSTDREDQGNLQGEPDGSSSIPFQDSSSDDGEAKNDFRYISGNYIYRHHFEPRVKLYVPQRSIIPNSTEIYRRYQNDRYFLGFFGTLMEIENGQIRGQVSQDSLYWMKETTRWVHMVGERLTKKNKRLWGQPLCGQRFGKIWPMHSNVKSSKSGLSRNLNSIMPEDCVVFLVRNETCYSFSQEQFQ